MDKPIKLLLVDDEAGFRKNHRQFFTRRKIACETTASCMEAMVHNSAISDIGSSPRYHMFYKGFASGVYPRIAMKLGCGQELQQ